MKKKISIWKKQRIIFLVSGITAILLCVYAAYFLHDFVEKTNPLNILLFMAGAVSLIHGLQGLFDGYQVLTREQIADYETIKVLSIYEIGQGNKTWTHTYEIELENGKIFLFSERNENVLIPGIKYTMNRKVYWS